MHRKPRSIDGESITDNALPIMPGKCSTCPFGNNDVLGVREDIEAVLLRSARVCHHHELHQLVGTYICRGAFDKQCELMFRLGAIEAPTEEAWNKKREEMGFPGRRNR